MYFQKPPLGTPLDWGNPLNDETVLALALNEGNGDTVQDLSLNGNHGTLHNFAFPPTAASGWNPGQTGVGLNFDGVNDWIDCGADSVPTDMITVSVLMKYGADPTTFNGMMMYKGSNRCNLYSRFINSRIYFTVGDGVVHGDALIPFADIDTSKWHNIIGTYNGTDTKIYLDGVLKDTDSGYSGQIVTAGTDLLIGSGNGLDFNGPIDQPRIQSRAWTAKEVKDYAINPWQVYLDE